MDTTLSFSLLLGQERAKKLLFKALASERLAHAYLFRGPDGVGKRLCAELVAARLNCQSPVATDGCGTCSSCRKHLSGNHPDIAVISPENGTIKIDRVRSLCRSLSYPPYESEVRIVVLEDVHTMRTEAANSLLKTLEEPPEKNLLILTAESSREVLPTILSRCQVVPFYGLTPEQTVSVLHKHCGDLDSSEVEMLSRLSSGSPGKALVLHEEELIGVWRLTQQILMDGSRQREVPVPELLQAAEKLASLKNNLIPLLGLIRIWFRDLMVHSVDGSALKILEKGLARLDQAERQLARNCNRTLVSEVLLFDLQSLIARVSL